MHKPAEITARLSIGSWSNRRLIATAATLHVLLAIGLFLVARAQVVPGIVDSEGVMGSFAFDSYEYQRGAVQLAEFIRHGELLNWATAAQPVHVKLIAIPLAILGPVFGYGPLSAEPYNLFCYLAVVTLVFVVGSEVGGRRTGVLAGVIVALWPTFLLHTMQLLKDPLFVTASLAFLLCVVTWLTRTYSSTATIAFSAVTVFLMLLLYLVRISFVWVLIAVAFLGMLLLIVRQVQQRRLLIWNMLLPVTVLFTALLLIGLSGNHSSEAVKRYPSDQSGPPKFSTDITLQVPSLVTRVFRQRSHTFTGQVLTVIDEPAHRISSMRSRFAASYPEAGSVLDGGTEFRTVNDLFAYLPRAMEIGLWAPFPSMWIAAGRRVGNLGKLLSGAETFVIYIFQVLAIVAVIRAPRHLALWLLLAISMLGVTALGLVVPNVGALYRFRYAFWMMVIIAAMCGLNDLLTTEQRS